MTGPESKEPETEEKKEAPVAPKKPIISKVDKSLFTFVKENLWETVSYILLFCGLILSIFSEFFGGLLVGLILGLYFAQEVIDRASAFKEFIGREGIFRGFIIIAAIIALLIEAPGLLIGTVIGTWIRPLIGNAISSPFDKP